ncbi:MAG: hypothetical protein MUE94_06720 [Verrucomicrobia bacterium]|nr:hypothetical protein [Verrucomicrobiota bacterium]
MKTALTILTTSLTLLVAGAAGLLLWQVQQNRQLTTIHAQLARELQDAQGQISALTAERARATDQLTTLAARETELRKRVASLESAAQTLPRPYRVRTFVGQDPVGEAWMVPHNVTRDAESGRYAFEPVLVIDESARRHFTQYQTNVVEREVFRTEIHENDYVYPFYYAVAPARPGRPGHPPGKPKPPTAPGPKDPGVSPQPDIGGRVFAPPTSTLGSRSQVFGPPAASPINQQVFAP